MEHKIEWIESDVVLTEHQNIEITQVYVWLYPTDQKLIIVSKNGEKWQFPGGHPEEACKIKFVKAMTLNEVFERITWLSSAEEYGTISKKDFLSLT